MVYSITLPLGAMQLAVSRCVNLLISTWLVSEDLCILVLLLSLQCSIAVMALIVFSTC
jgi:hypothetical protein